MFEQPGFLKHCTAIPHITADGKQRWSSLWKISHLYSGAAEKHDNNYAAAQITQCTNVFPSSHSCHARREETSVICAVQISAWEIFLRGQKEVWSLGTTLLNCEGLQ